ncbi:MAG: hypothetical protein WB869_07840, partial [Candidatus Acidiferrales bacterium]
SIHFVIWFIGYGIDEYGARIGVAPSAWHRFVERVTGFMNRMRRKRKSCGAFGNTFGAGKQWARRGVGDVSSTIEWPDGPVRFVSQAASPSRLA